MRFDLLVIFLFATNSRAQLHQKALKAYNALEFKKASELFGKEVAELKPSELGHSVELDAREKYVLSLYQSGRKDKAREEYTALKQRFPSFEFNDNEVLPETIEFFAATVNPVAAPPGPLPPRADEPPPSQPQIIVAAPAEEQRLHVDAPETLVVKKPWRPQYLAPLGIGQFLAGSPVRGVIFAVLQAGFAAADIALFVHYNNVTDGQGRADDVAQGYRVQYAMNTMFFAMIGSVVAGLIDGAFFEP